MFGGWVGKVDGKVVLSTVCGHLGGGEGSFLGGGMSGGGLDCGEWYYLKGRRL